MWLREGFRLILNFNSPNRTFYIDQFKSIDMHTKKNNKTPIFLVSAKNCCTGGVSSELSETNRLFFYFFIDIFP